MVAFGHKKRNRVLADEGGAGITSYGNRDRKGKAAAAQERRDATSGMADFPEEAGVDYLTS